MKNIIICSTQRSGSTLACRDMESTGKLGNPGEWFFRRKWCEKGMADPKHWEQSLRDVMKQGSSENGVFSVKVMANYYQKILEKFKTIPQYSQLPYHLILDHVFQNPLFLRIYRRNKVKQAISRLIAKQTKVYHSREGEKQEIDWSKLHIDNKQIVRVVGQIREEEFKWDIFFEKLGKEPLEIFYEDFEDDPTFFVQRIGKELDLPEKIEPSGREMKKLYNEINETLYRDFLLEKERIFDNGKYITLLVEKK